MTQRHAESPAPGSPLARIVGGSESMQRLRHHLDSIAPLGSTVLLTGETGTGKGLAARVVHQLSPRASEPFVHVDCAALSPTLVESELFGHERGSFTNAEVRRTGRFELAAGGTIFLDEIGDLESRLQSKLLRVLDDREFERIGGTQTLRMRARVIAATSRDLRRAVAEERFRADLLRQRASDLTALVEDGLGRAARRLGMPRARSSPELLERLSEHSWPGNVRELRNVLERLAAAHPGETLRAADAEPLLETWHVPPRPGPRAAAGADGSGAAPGLAPRSLPDLRDQLDAQERREILAALERSRGNVTRAAQRLQIPRSTLRHRIRKHGLGHREQAPAPPPPDPGGDEPA
jgi:DNA-binding NtrC family response regulator